MRSMAKRHVRAKAELFPTLLAMKLDNLGIKVLRVQTVEPKSWFSQSLSHNPWLAVEMCQKSVSEA